MDTSLKLYFEDSQGTVYNFPYAMQQAELFDFTVNKTRMGSAPTITATLEYPSCLDREWEQWCHFDDIFVIFNNERYYLKATPASSKSNDKLFYKHELTFINERAVLETVYMIDDLENQTANILLSNNTQITFFGNINEFVERINQSMYFSGIGDTCVYDTTTTPPTLVPPEQRDVNHLNALNGDGYYVVVDSGVAVADEVLVTLNNNTIFDALKQIFDKYSVPFYFVGKIIHIGNYEAVTETTPTYTDSNGVLGAGLSSGALVPYEYGQPNAVLTVNRNNNTKELYNRCSGTGSSDNIPYYYPNPTPNGFLAVEADSGNDEVMTGDLEIVDMLLFSQKMNINSVCEYKGEYSDINISSNKMMFPGRFYQDGVWTNGQISITLPYKIQISSQLAYDLDLYAQYYDFYTGQFTGSGENMYFRNTLSISIPEGQLPDETYIVPLSYLTRAVVKNVGKYVNGVFISGQFESDKYLFASNNYKFFATDDFVYMIYITYYIPSSILEWSMNNSPSGNHIYVSLTTGFNASSLWAIDGETERENFVKLSDIGISLDAGVTPTLGDKFYQRLEKYIHPQEKLMPSCYRSSDGKKKFYPAKNYPFSASGVTPDTDLGEEIVSGNIENNNYKENGTYFSFANPHRKMRQKEHLYDFPDIRPTIEGMENGLSQRIDMFEDVAFDTNDDNSGYYDDNGNFVYNHPYFFVKLRMTDGNNGFNLFDQAIDEGEMTIALTSGDCAPCEFVIGVDKETQKNTVQVDGSGNLKRNEYGDVICGRGEGSNPQVAQSPQPRQNDTKNNEVWIALKKDIETYGEIMPYNDSVVRISPKACTSSSDNDGDTFVILHIEMPLAYVTAAEEKLAREIIKQMNADNSEKFNFSLKYSRVYLGENQDLTDLLSENVKVLAKYDGITKQFFAASYSYRMQASSPIPEITIGGLVETVDELKMVAAIGGNGFVRRVGEHIAENFAELMMGVNRPFTRIINQNNTHVTNQIKGEFPSDYVRTEDELDFDSVILGAGARHVRKLKNGSNGQILKIINSIPTWANGVDDISVDVKKISSNFSITNYYTAITGLTFNCDEGGKFLIDAQIQISVEKEASTQKLVSAYLSTDEGKTAISSGEVDVQTCDQINIAAYVELEKESSVMVFIKCATNGDVYANPSINGGLSNATMLKAIKIG